MSGFWEERKGNTCFVGWLLLCKEKKRLCAAGCRTFFPKYACNFAVFNCRKRSGSDLINQKYALVAISDPWKKAAQNWKFCEQNNRNEMGIGWVVWWWWWWWWYRQDAHFWVLALGKWLTAAAANSKYIYSKERNGGCLLLPSSRRLCCWRTRKKPLDKEIWVVEDGGENKDGKIWVKKERRRRKAKLRWERNGGGGGSEGKRSRSDWQLMICA